jgi:hypothetical protein
MEGAYKRVNLPAGREFAEMNDTLRRLEDKLDRLLAAHAEAKPPPRTRKPAAGAPAAKSAKPRKAAAAPRRRSAP